MSLDAFVERLRPEIEAYFRSSGEGPSGKYRIPLAVPTYGSEEVVDSLRVLLSAQVTMGEEVYEFERQFARYLDVEHAVMVNSGSSANLIALAVLANPVLGNRRIKPGSEVIVPAVSWSTSLFPVVQMGARPVLVDIRDEDYVIDVREVERALSKRTRAIMAVHLLGTPCDMRDIQDLAARHGLFVVEDTCEAVGAEFGGRKAGTLGDLGTFSFFFSHHISTIEGGMIVTNNGEFAEIARLLRAHGWIREISSREEVARKHPQIDPRFLFVNLGYNLRPTEIQGVFGQHQIRKLEGFIRRRHENAEYWNKKLSKYSHFFQFLPVEEREGFRRVWFAYPLRIRPDAPIDRDDFASHLEHGGIETRPIMSGNLAEQPALTLFDHRVVGELPVATATMHKGLLCGAHHRIDEADRAHLVECVEEFLEMKGVSA